MYVCECVCVCVCMHAEADTNLETTVTLRKRYKCESTISSIWVFDGVAHPVVATRLLCLAFFFCFFVYVGKCILYV